MTEERWTYRKIKLDDMIEYIETKAPQDKTWFKSIAFDEKGKYQHLKAVKEFCNRYMPDIVPKGKPKAPNKSEKLKDW